MMLPMSPMRSCIVTYMGGNELHYSFGVAAIAALIDQPTGSQIDLFTANQLRAYGEACARAALEEAAKIVAMLPREAEAIRAIEVQQ